MVCRFPSSFCSVLRLNKMAKNIAIEELLDNPFSVCPNTQLIKDSE